MAAFTLSSGQRIPAVAYGTGTAWYNKEDGGPLNRELIDSIKEALKLGYRHLDGAEMYGTEREVGVALREFTVESGVPRSDIFVTTKVFRSLPNVKQARPSAYHASTSCNQHRDPSLSFCCCGSEHAHVACKTIYKSIHICTACSAWQMLVACCVPFIMTQTILCTTCLE